MVTFTLPDSHSATVMALRLYAEYGIFVKPTGRALLPDEWPVGAPESMLRVSFHIFNTESDVTRVVAALKKLL